MSYFYRKASYRRKLFVKSLHMLVCNKKLATVLPSGFTKEEYVTIFKDCFPYLWDDIVAFCETERIDYKRRKRKELRALSSYTPKGFLLKHAHLQRLKTISTSEEERNRNKEQLIQSGRNKLQQRKEKLEKNLVYVQETCPPYVDKLTKAYFSIRKKNTLDVNARYLIILEASQFKCKQTLSFLHKINSCDKNQDLRKMAFFALQRMGEHPWLARERKGKRRLSQVKRIDIQKNPTELLKLISKHQSLLYQKFDFFLSHSSRDEFELLNIKSILNRQGYTVYIDWVNDREMLNRANQDKNTWNALFLRMDQSERLLYVMTDNCINSEYTKKEVEYCIAKNRSVYVYQPQPISLPKPDYLNGCIELANIDRISL